MILSATLGLLAVGGTPTPDQTARVAGFLPSQNALHFDNNHWPNVPNYTVSIFNHDITVGNASSGLCGGMVFAVRDLFEAHLPAPATTTPPDPGTPLFNYIVAGLTRTFTFKNVARYIDWIQSSDASTDTGKGICWHEIKEEWPLVKADIDAGLPSPLGLVHGRERPGLGYITGFLHLANCHQVLAWGYDVAGTVVTIHLYDPNFLGDDQTITLDIANPDQATPITVTGYSDGRFRAFFREAYSYHDPRTPITCKFAGSTVISSPGISL